VPPSKQKSPSLGSFYFTEEIISSNSRIGSFVSAVEEAARVLKESGAREVRGVVVARAQPGEDKLENI